MKKIILLVTLTLTLAAGSIFAQQIVPQDVPVHNFNDGKVKNYGYVNDKDHGPWNFIAFTVETSTGLTLHFAIPANLKTDAELNRLLAVIASAYHSQSTIRVYHNNYWLRPHDNFQYYLADRIFTGTF